MQGGVVELAKQAAAAARAERGARGAARLPVRRYRGVMRRGDVYVAEIMDAAGLRPVLLGAYETAEEAAYAYDAAARIMHGDKAKPNFPESPAPAPRLGGGGAPAAHARVLPLLGHARVRRAPLYAQQPAPVSGGVERHQAFSVVQQAAPAQNLGAPPVPYHGEAAPAFPQFSYHPVAGPAFAAVAGGSNGAGFYAAGPALAAVAGGGNGAGFYGMASAMIGPEPGVPMLTYAASSALSSSDKKNKAIVDASAATEPNLVIIIASDFDGEPVVEDNLINFPGDGGASTSSAASPAVPPLDQAQGFDGSRSSSPQR